MSAIKPPTSDELGLNPLLAAIYSMISQDPMGGLSPNPMGGMVKFPMRAGNPFLRELGMSTMRSSDDAINPATEALMRIIKPEKAAKAKAAQAVPLKSPVRQLPNRDLRAMEFQSDTTPIQKVIDAGALRPGQVPLIQQTLDRITSQKVPGESKDLARLWERMFGSGR